jgi:hypothetical protein
MESIMAEAEQPLNEDSETQQTPDMADDRLLKALYGDQEQPQDDVETQGEETPPGEQADAEAAAQAKAEAEALAEIEFEGQQYKVPPKLKDAFMAQSKFTQLTQQLADQRRMLDINAQQVQKQAELQKVIMPDITALGGLDVELAKYDKLDWANLDTDNLIRAKHGRDTLMEQRQKLLGQIREKGQKFEQDMATIRGQAVEKGREYLKRAVPQWNDDATKEAVSWAVQHGYSDQFVQSSVDPVQAEAWYKAAQWDKLQSQKGAVAQKANQAPPLGKPAAVNTQSVQAQRDKAYRAALKGATTTQQRNRVIDARLAEKFL